MYFITYLKSYLGEGEKWVVVFVYIKCTMIIYWIIKTAHRSMWSVWVLCSLYLCNDISVYFASNVMMKNEENPIKIFWWILNTCCWWMVRWAQIYYRLIYTPRNLAPSWYEIIWMTFPSLMNMVLLSESFQLIAFLVHNNI